MAGLLALLGPAGRVGSRVRPRATWLLGAAAPCAPPPLALALLPPRPDSRLLRTARGDCRGRQDLSQPTETTGSSVSCTEEKKLSKSQQLKKIFQEYGTVGVSVHIGISLISLGIFYMVVSRNLHANAYSQSMINVKNQKQPRYPSVDEQTEILPYNEIMEYDLVIDKNK
ncbi:protein FAM210B, mitochondrial isoform X2 [Cebus imitator]|uniref:protein FAM210B, mitochondrial isoform X2 n=1 Tax=Cebus imitator TaxID=2715852 RepID=UPI00080A6929|nr:protein FAM210B, mitochondrial isoform X2 [Cebus imitator]